MRNCRLCFVLCCLSLVAMFSSSALKADQNEPTPLEKAFAALPAYDWGPQRDELLPIDIAAARCHGDAVVRSELEQRVVKCLESETTLAAKEYICEILATIGTARAVPALKLLLEQSATSHMSRMALENITDSSAAAALRDMLPNVAKEQQIGIIHSIGRIGDAKAVQALQRLLSDENDGVVQAAAEALGKIDSEQAIAPLLAFYRDSTDAKKALALDAVLDTAQRLLRQKKVEEASRVYQVLASSTDRQVRWAAFVGLVRMDPVRAPARLVKALADQDRQYQRMVGQLIHEVVDQENITEFTDAFRGLPVSGQIVLLDALRSFQDENVRAVALECLKHEDLVLRMAAEHALAKSGRAADVNVLTMLASTTDVDEEQAVVAETLVSMKDDKVDAALLDVLTQAEAAQQVIILHTIARRRTPNAAAKLIGLTGSQRADVRIATYQALQALADSSLVNELVQRLATTPSGKEREAADRAVWRCCLETQNESERATQLLAKIKESGRQERIALLPALGRVGGRDALPVVLAAIDSDDTKVKDAGVRALANWPDVDVVEQLWKIAKKSENKSHRIWALRAIARLVPQMAREHPQLASDHLRAAMGMADRVDDKRLILSRLKAARVPDSLSVVLSLLDDKDLKEDAIDVAVDLGEAMKDSHPKESRVALERVAPLTDNPELAMHIGKILWNMQLKGN